jgi:hypothetical protein
VNFPDIPELGHADAAERRPPHADIPSPAPPLDFPAGHTDLFADEIDQASWIYSFLL